MEARQRPAGRPVMYQRWRQLLFLHWEWDVAALQATLPSGLTVDTHEGKGYLGVVPFYMENVRPRGLPAVPGISNFLELNVRTYVHDDRGVPGVWFHSLDCNQFLAVNIARALFHLPYEHASMQAKEEPAQSFQALRKGQKAPARFEFSPLDEVVEAEQGSIEFFLLERYVLFSARRSGSLHEGRVHHAPYRYHRSLDLKSFSSLPIEWDGFPAPQRQQPDHVCFAPGVEVDIFPLKRLS